MSPAASTTTSTTYTFTAKVTERGTSLSSQWSQPFTVTTSGGGGGSSGLVGATVNNSAYPGTTRASAATLFDGYIGGGRNMAYRVQKSYLQPAGTIPTSIGSPETDLHAMGVKNLVSVKPGWPTTTGQIALLDSWLNQAKNAGYNLEIDLYQEPLGAGKFINGADYVNYVKFYGPTIKKYYPLIFNPNCNPGTISQVPSYYPGDALVDKIMVDWYCTGWLGGVTLDIPAGLANAANPKKPFGIAEWGISVPITGVPTIAQFNSYCAYIVSYFKGRKAQGLPNADIIYFDGNLGGAPGPGPCTVSGPTDPMIPGIQSVYDNLH